jgi:23S rRNA (adenine2503-C2)-methyltransferase
VRDRLPEKHVPGRASDATQLPSLDGKLVLLGLNLPELTEMVESGGFPAFRAKQLFHWMYHKAALSFDEMHNIASDFRDWMKSTCTLGHIGIATVREAADGTRKILFRLRDGKLVEGVLIMEDDWFTLCVSSQVGCAVGCTFCMTGFGGFQRQMSRAEIVSQVLVVKRLVHAGKMPRNLVFMGMGEPMLNMDEIVPSLRVLSDPDGIAIAARRITVSTSGILPGIERLGRERLSVSLAISLNASDNAFRSRIMPINRTYPIESLLEACKAFPLQARRRITFEYVLLGGINDSVENARALAGLLQGIPCKINLIPFNPDSRLPFQRPSEETVRRFQDYLIGKFFTASIRYSKGLDIGAACGQLAGHWQPGLAAGAS